MPRCAFLTTDQLEEFFVYDALVKPHLADLGWQVDDVSWHNESVDYNDYDVVVVRSTWDYQAYPTKFVDTLSKIDHSTAILQNPYELMLWNFSKTYLQDIEKAGVQILPTLWYDSFSIQNAQQAFKHFNASEIIIKPCVSANADFTYRLTEEALLFEQKAIKDALDQRAIMIQAFEKNILEEGEFSLFYFAGEYSHTINKRPAIGDFRVQEEHGGQLFSVEPSNEMLTLAEKSIQHFPEQALYARIDMLETSAGMAIIELELIEPSLYFNMDEHSAKRFAIALHKQFTQSLEQKG